jgi:hypothetical protein
MKFKRKIQISLSKDKNLEGLEMAVLKDRVVQ